MGAGIIALAEVIANRADLDRGLASLVRLEPRFGDAVAIAGPPDLRRKADGFPALLDAIVAQQVSVASANAIWRRLGAAGLVEQVQVKEANEDALRKAGLSRPKCRYILDLARADLDWNALRDMADTEVIDALCTLPGIGRWSADIYLLSALGRIDVLPAGDLALQKAAHALFELPERPDEAAFREMGRDWSPVRSVAARVFWTYYRHLSNRGGAR